MLNKKDLEKIEKIMGDKLQEFFETLILPYFEHNEKDHAEIKEALKRHDNQLNENANDHERIFRALERNRD
ncbi:MAG: hypothetical protein HY429_04850 [Candidatus Levybacteria bacterium]|nr:hypothetical protein [Candidatus Levybacteria bacterium]